MATKNKESYRDNPLLKRIGVQVNFTEEQVEEYIKCSKDPIYFAKYIKIITLDEGVVPFNMYDFQKDMMRTFDENRFVIVKCPRQVCKTTTTVAYLLYSAGLKNLPANEAATLTLAEPVTATIFGVTLLAEHPPLLTWVGALVVLAGLAILSRSPAQTSS